MPGKFLLPVLLLLIVTSCTKKEPYLWIGAATDSSFIVAMEIRGPSEIRIATDTTSYFHRPAFTPVHDAVHGRHKIEVTNLQPDTQYYWDLEIDGVLQQIGGRIRTFPSVGYPASFSFAVGHCARSGSNAITFERILNRNPLFFLHTGDMHYADIAADDVELFYREYRRVLSQPRQRDLYRRVPIIYTWDDHDFGPNDSDRHSPARRAALLAYRNYVPHYPLVDGPPDDTPIHQKIWVGRVLILNLDNRTNRDNTENDTILGTQQLQWVLDILQNEAREAGLLILQVGVPWIAETKDTWGQGQAERRAISEAIERNGLTNRTLIYQGDAHFIAIDDGSNNTFADAWPPGPPVYSFGPLDQRTSVKGGPYSEGYFIDSETQYGIIEIQDDGRIIRVTGSGYDASDDRLILRHQFVIDFPHASYALHDPMHQGDNASVRVEKR